jgi:hypothetical protein
MLPVAQALRFLGIREDLTATPCSLVGLLCQLLVARARGHFLLALPLVVVLALFHHLAVDRAVVLVLRELRLLAVAAV